MSKIIESAKEILEHFSGSTSEREKLESLIISFPSVSVTANSKVRTWKLSIIHDNEENQLLATIKSYAIHIDENIKHKKCEQNTSEHMVINLVDTKDDICVNEKVRFRERKNPMLK